MASIHKEGGRWFVRWRDSSGKNRSRTTPDRNTATELAGQIERANALGRDWEAEKPPTRPDIVTVAEEWVRSIALRLDKRTTAVRVYQLSIFERWATGSCPTGADLSSGALEGYLRWLASEPGRHGRVRSRTTQLRLVEIVEQMWAWAAEEAGDRNWSIPRARRISTQIPRPVAGWRPAPTWAEMAACVGAADGWLRPLLIVLYYTGLRPNQALRLAADDLDRAGRVLVIRPELGKSRQERAGRLIPVSAHLVTALADLPPTNGLLLPCARRSRTADDAAAAAVWSAAGVRAAAWKGRPHTAFRAGFQTQLLAASRNVVGVELLVGHKVTDTAPNYLDPEAFGMRAIVDLIPSLESLWSA